MGKKGAAKAKAASAAAARAGATGSTDGLRTPEKNGSSSCHPTLLVLGLRNCVDAMPLPCAPFVI